MCDHSVTKYRTIKYVRVATEAYDATPFVASGTPITSCDSFKFELHLKGLKDPYTFKEMVVSKVAGSKNAASVAGGLVELVSTSLTNSDSTTVLTEIRNELKRHNDLLESQNDSPF